MTPQISLLSAIVCGVVSAAVCTEVTTYYIHLPTGSSVLIPGPAPAVRFNDEMIHELRKIGGTPEWLAQYHGSPATHKAYATRGQYFHQNKSFLLERLTKEDSGVYEQRVNQVTLVQVHLVVIDPVPKPTLSRQEDDSGGCLLHLHCSHPGGDEYNVTFMTDGENSNGNVTKNSDFSILLVDGTNPQHWGTYTCNASNLISWNVSEDLLVEPQGIPEEEVPFYVCLAGLGIYVVILITHVLWSIKQLNDYQALKDFIYVARTICGTVLECAALFIFSYYGYHFRDEWRSLIGGMLLFSFILLVRIAWRFLIKYGSPMRWITVAEAALLLADSLLIPGIFMAEVVFIYQGNDLCGMKMQTRWRGHLYLGIAMVAILLAVCLYGLYRKSHSIPVAQEQQKVPLVERPGDNGAAEEHSETNESQARRDNDPSMANNSSSEDEEEEDGAGRGTGCPHISDEEDSTDNIYDPQRYNSRRQIMDDQEDDGRLTDTEMSQDDERSEEGIPLQDEGGME